MTLLSLAISELVRREDTQPRGVSSVPPSPTKQRLVTRPRHSAGKQDSSPPDPTPLTFAPYDGTRPRCVSEWTLKEEVTSLNTSTLATPTKRERLQLVTSGSSHVTASFSPTNAQRTTPTHIYGNKIGPLILALCAPLFDSYIISQGLGSVTPTSRRMKGIPTPSPLSLYAHGGTY